MQKESNNFEGTTKGVSIQDQNQICYTDLAVLTSNHKIESSEHKSNYCTERISHVVWKPILITRSALSKSQQCTCISVWFGNLLQTDSLPLRRKGWNRNGRPWNGDGIGNVAGDLEIFRMRMNLEEMRLGFAICPLQWVERGRGSCSEGNYTAFGFRERKKNGNSAGNSRNGMGKLKLYSRGKSFTPLHLGWVNPRCVGGRPFFPLLSNGSWINSFFFFLKNSGWMNLNLKIYSNNL